MGDSGGSRDRTSSTAATATTTAATTTATTTLSRRAFLGRTAGLGVGLGAAALGGLGLPVATARVAFAAPADHPGDVLVVLSLRGGFDAMSAIVPLGDPDYRPARPTIAVPPARALPTADRFWGLHPGLAPLKPWWDGGRFGAVHAVGAPDPTRSHFAATVEMERAAPGSSVRTGWLDRALGLRAATTPFQGMVLGDGLVPQSLAGPFAELALPSVDRFGLDGVWGDTAAQKAADTARWAAALTALHDDIAPLRSSARTALDAIASAAAVTATAYSPANGAVYPHTVDGGPFADSALSAALCDVARLIRAGVGLQAVCLEFGDWDMHAGLGTVDSGRFRDQVSELAVCLAAFLTDLGPTGSADVTIVTMSEFGRRVAENGDHGLDHGHGNAMLVLGGGAVGGVVHGPWPGLAADRLDDGDLAGTTDYRDVLAEILVNRCRQPAADLASVFPGRGRFAPVGVVTARA